MWYLFFELIALCLLATIASSTPPQPRELLERYRKLAHDHEKLDALEAKVRGRSPKLSCPNTPPVALLQGRRVLRPLKMNATQRAALRRAANHSASAHAAAGGSVVKERYNLAGEIVLGGSL